MTHSISLLKDIIFPMINFIGFVGILIYFLRKPLKNMFYSRSLDIEKQIEGARQALIEAQTNYEEAKEKFSGVQTEKEAYERRSEEELKFLKEKTKKEISDFIQRLKIENEQKIQEAIKKEREVLKSQLVDQIIISVEKSLKTSFSDKQQELLIEDFLKGEWAHENKERGAVRSSTR